MAEAQPANASTVRSNELIALACALLFSSPKKKQIYFAVAESISLQLNATALALLVAETLQVSEPTARRAVQKLKQLQLIEGENGFPVKLTALGEHVFGSEARELAEGNRHASPRSKNAFFEVK